MINYKIYMFILISNVIFIMCDKTKLLLPNVQNNLMYKLTEKIIEHCYNKNDRNVFMINNSDIYNLYFLRSSFSSLIAINLFGINNNTLEKFKRFRNVYVLSEIVFTQMNQPASGIIIMNANNAIFEKTFKNLKDSLWWNNEAYFLIVNVNFGGCTNARKVLNTIWSYNVMSVVYLCYNLDKRLLLYTFNPYADLSPKIWKKVETSNGYKENWTLFKCTIDSLTFLSQSSMCNVLFYDKARDVHGYNIKAVFGTNSKQYSFEDHKFKYNRCRGNVEILCAILKHINATLSVKESGIGGTVVKGGKKGMINDVFEGKADMVVHTFLIRDYWKLQTYPFYADEIKIITRKHSVKFGDKFIAIFNTNVVLLLFTFTCLTTMTLRFFLHQSVVAAFLNFIRILTSSASLGKLNKLSEKIFLITAIFSVFTFNTYFQGGLSAINAITDYVSFIDTIDDLIESNLSINGLSTYKDLIFNKIILDRFNFSIDFNDCLVPLRKNEPSVCVMAASYLGYYVYENDTIHISTGSLSQRATTLMCSEDLPLLNKFNWILLRLLSSGIISLFYNRDKYFYMRKQTIKIADIPLNLQDLYIAFGVLIGGLSIGFVLLICEIAIRNTKEHVAKKELYRYHNITNKRYGKILFPFKRVV